MAHSLEPWVFNIDPDECPEILSANKLEVIIPALRDADEDLKRIVVCVNACTLKPLLNIT